MQATGTNRSRCLSGFSMGIGGAVVWATLLFALSMYVGGGSWRAEGVAISGCITVAYLAFLASLVLAPLGALIGWQMPRRLNGLRPWPVFLLGCYTGAFAGALTALGFMSAWAVQAGWSALQDSLPFYLLTFPTVFGLWTGLWMQRWRDRLPEGFVAGRLYWDGACPFCIRWVSRLAFVARQGGFALVPLQSEEARRDLGLREGELPAEMKLRLADGRLLGGLDAFIAMAEAAGWPAPLGWFLRVRGVNALAWRGYRWVARNRHCLGGSCAVPPPEGGARVKPAHNAAEECGPRPCRRVPAAAKRSLSQERVPYPPATRRLEAAGTGLRATDILLTIALPTAVWLVTAGLLPPWLRMWTLVGAEVLAVKWLMLRFALARGDAPSRGRQLAFLFGWAGTDATRFLRGTAEPVQRAEWVWAAAHLLTGLACALAGAQFVATAPVAAAWLGMLGMVLAGHFGGTQLLALAWRTRGVDAPPLMRTPIAATSLADFWGARWNLAFAVPARDLLFKPLARRIGVAGAMLAVFAVSGLLHETVIALPAGNGWGWPTAYFLFQGVAVLFEKSAAGRALGLGRGARGWLFVLACAAGPAWWLFPPDFATTVVAPMLFTLNPFTP